MEANLAKKIVDYVGCTAAALEQAQKMAEANETRASKVAEKVPELVVLLKKHDYIDATLEKDAGEVLQDPVKSLELLKRVIEKSAQAIIGSPLTPTNSGPVQSNYIGQRGYQRRESDRIFEERLGIAS